MSSKNVARNMNSGYGSTEETDSLLLSPTTKSKPVITSSILVSSQCQTNKQPSINGPTNMSTTSKPILIRQGRTSTYLASPQLSQTTQGASDDSATGDEDPEGNIRTVPDIEVYTHSERIEKHEKPAISISNSTDNEAGVADVPHASTSSTATIIGTYQLSPQNRCRACRNCDRRASTTPVTTLQFGRSVSKDSVRSAFQGTVTSSSGVQHVPPVLITSSPTSGSRIIRQSSQPEASNVVCCGGHVCGHSHTAPNVSLRQLREPSDGIAGIAADSLRINGGMRPFKQGILLCPQTLSQSRRTRLRRAFTEATSDTLQYVKTVSSTYPYDV